MSVHDVAKDFTERYNKIVYPTGPTKPKREDFPDYRRHGIAMDEYEKEMSVYREARTAVRLEARNIESEFKQALAKELGLEDHPKFDKMYQIAYENGHSAGFNEIAIHADQLAELLRD